jgi:hypothetical protein
VRDLITELLESLVTEDGFDLTTEEDEIVACSWGVQRLNSMCGVSRSNSFSGLGYGNTFTRRREPTQ